MPNSQVTLRPYYSRLCLKDISSIQVGDSLKALNGNSRVVFVSKIRRSDRTLYSLNGLPFCFTDTQPFVNYASMEQASQPVYAAILPDRLQSFCPTLGWEGITKLSENSLLVNGADLKQQNIESIEPHYQAEDSSEFLYDLIVTPSQKTGHFEYFTACEEVMLLTVSEISSIPGSTTYTLEALLTMLLIIKKSTEFLRPHFKYLSFSEISSKLDTLIKVTHSHMYHSFHSSKHMPPLESSSLSQPLVKEYILNLIFIELAEYFNHEFDFEKYVTSKLFALLNFHHLRELEHLFALQCRERSSKGAAYIAITVLQFNIDSHILQQAESKVVTRLEIEVKSEEGKLFKRSMLPIKTNSNSYQTVFFQCLYLELE